MGPRTGEISLEPHSFYFLFLNKVTGHISASGCLEIEHGGCKKDAASETKRRGMNM